MSVVKRLLPLLVLILAALAAGAGYRAWQAERAPQDSLTLYGNVEVREVALGFNVAGRVDAMAAEEGDAVAAGDILARLETGRFEATVAAARAEFDARRAALDALETGTRPEEIARAEAVVDEAATKLENAEARYRRTLRLAGDNFASQQALDDARSARDEAEAALRRARQELALARAGPREEAIRGARADVRAAQARLDLTRTDLDDTTLAAPTEGRILTRVHESGAIVGGGEPVYTLAIERPVRIRVYVEEPWLGRVRPGMAVTVTTDSDPDRPVEGRVAFVSPSAEFTPKSVQTPDLRTGLVYRVRIVVQEPGDGLRQGMPVTVTLPLEPAGAGAGS